LNPKLEPLPAASNASMEIFFWNICISLQLCDISWKTLIVSQKLMKYKEKTLIWEGPNLSFIPELLGIGSKNPAVLLVDR
jgi:hypothetical protein